MNNPSADQAIDIIDDLVNKTLNTQEAFNNAIERLLKEADRIRETVEDTSLPLSDYETKMVLLNVSYIIRELGGFDKGFGELLPKAPHPKMTYEVEADAIKQ